MWVMAFPGGSDGNESACSRGDLGLIPGLGRSPGEENCYPLQYSCLENSMDGGTWKLQSKRSQRVGHSWVTNTFTLSSGRWDEGWVSEGDEWRRRWHWRWTWGLRRNHPCRTGDYEIRVIFLQCMHVPQHMSWPGILKSIILIQKSGNITLNVQ